MQIIVNALFQHHPPPPLPRVQAPTVLVNRISCSASQQTLTETLHQTVALTHTLSQNEQATISKFDRTGACMSERRKLLHIYIGHVVAAAVLSASMP